MRLYDAAGAYCKYYKDKNINMSIWFLELTLLYRFPQILDEALKHTRVFDIENEDGAIFEEISVKRDAPPLAKVPIMYGCNNFCSYCVVPYVRGRGTQQKRRGIFLRSAEELLMRVIKKIMLLGQNVNSYGNDLPSGTSFSELLKLVCRTEELKEYVL